VCQLFQEKEINNQKKSFISLLFVADFLGRIEYFVCFVRSLIERLEKFSEGFCDFGKVGFQLV
jgi:hypothetical protein